MRTRATKTKREGFVIIVVLCMVVTLSILLLIFNEESRANLSAVEDFRKSAQALNYARAGLNVAIAAAAASPDADVDMSQPNLTSGESTISIDRRIKVTQESSKLNVNLLKDAGGKLDRTKIDHLLRLIDTLNRDAAAESNIDYSIVPAIIDWIDTDDEVTSLPFVKHKNMGAESSYYRRSSPPYKCRNAPIETIEELLQVKGMSPEVLDRLRDCLTVYGDGKININSVSKLMLESLSEEMDATLARIIIERRRLKPFESVDELLELPGMTDSLYLSISKTLTVDPKGEYYKVTARGGVDRIVRTVSAIIRTNEKTRNVEVVLYKEPNG